jgi:hypothetical protein
MVPQQPIAVPEDAIDAAIALRDQLNAGGAATYTVGVGLKQSGGEFSDQVAIFVYVQRKRPVAALAEVEIVPPEFGGYVTDVVDARPTLIDDEARYDPLRGGVQISRQQLLEDGIFAPRSGTLGAIVRSRATFQPQLLTCAHVARSVGLSVFQPGQGLASASVVGTVANLRSQVNPLFLDCAVIDPNGSRGVEMTVEEIGPVQGASVELPPLGEMVMKRGMRTSLTHGFVVRHIASTFTPAFDQFEISGAVPFVTLFAGTGDSGSVVLNSSNQVIGLLFAIPTEDLGVGLGSRGLAIPIHNVQEALQVDIAT